MLEHELLGAIDKAISEARLGAYALLELNEPFGEVLYHTLEGATEMIVARQKAIVRDEGRKREKAKQA